MTAIDVEDKDQSMITPQLSLTNSHTHTHPNKAVVVFFSALSISGKSAIVLLL